MEQPNIEYIDKISLGNIDFKHKVLGIIKEELPIEIDLYRYALKNNDYQKAANTVHKLKHKICIFGFNESYLIAQSFEEALHKGDNTLKNDFEMILDIMEDFIKKI